MNQQKYRDILTILKQIWWPVTITYQTQQIDLITEDLIRFHILKIQHLIEWELDLCQEYTIADIFSLYMSINHIINDLWIDEFHTVLWKDLLNHGYNLLLELKQILLNFPENRN